MTECVSPGGLLKSEIRLRNSCAGRGCASPRGLLKLDSTVDALPCYTAEKNVKLFATHKVLSESERYKSETLQEFLKSVTGKEKLDEASKMSEIILEIKDRIYQDN